jgi:hypothetical protein
MGQGQGIPCNGEESNGNFSLSVELFAENIGEIADFQGNVTDLTGYNTYRIYLNTEGPLDKLSAVYGDDSRPLSISSTQPFRQTPLFAGASNALVNVNNPVLFSTFPEILFDSYLTIGIDQAADPLAGQSTISIVEDAASPFAATFGSGGNILVNTSVGGAWYIDDADLYTNGDAGADGQVLIAQLTTQGSISGQMALQVFRNGEANSENCIRPYLSFQSHGCTDPNACNYEPTAILSDGSCNFCSCPDSTLVLTASFPSDSIPEYAIEVEVIADHDTTGITANLLGTVNPLSGMKTYRLYAKVDDPETRILAGYGTDTEVLNISTTTSFYQAVLGAATPSSISSWLFDLYPYEDIEYDSWITIGIDRSPSLMPPGYDVISTVNDPALNSFTEFEAGNALIANTNVGAAWLVSTPNAANVFPDSNLRVLIGQFTTSGTISGTLGLQIFPADAGAGEDQRLPFSFTTEGLGQWVEVANPLCDCDGTPDVDGDGICDEVDPCIGVYDYCGVCNGPGAIYDCGCYDIPDDECDCFGNALDAVGVCGGDCEADIDGDGVCDDEEVFGCTDTASCTFLAEATEEDGSCLYADAIGTCGGDCALDVDGNGICDTDDAAHCGPGTHWDVGLGLCVISCPADLNLDGAIAIGDLLDLLSQFATYCPILD